MTDIYLSVDAGGSQTKVIYQLKGAKKPDYFVLPPAIEEISLAKLDTYIARQGWIGNPTPDQQAWVKWNSRLVVLGDFASQFDPIDRLRELKYENFLWKVLAVVGLIVEKTKLKVSAKKPLLLQLAILLPWNEYNDRKRFEEQLKAMLANFEFRKQKLKIQLDKLLCRPEGGGLAAIRIKKQGIDWLQQQQLGVLMFGHRNTTALYFDRGQLKSGDSPLLGFSVMLDQVVSMVSGLDREGLATAIFKGMHAARNEIYNNDFKYTRHPTWEKLQAIQALASARDASLRTSEVRDIVKALQIATVEYWEKLERWLKKSLPERLNEVIVGGWSSLLYRARVGGIFQL